METCLKCHSKLSEIKETCPTCGTPVGYPNVRAAERREEKDALEARYLSAIKQSKANGREQALASFDESSKKTCAVINVDLEVLYQFITNDQMFYSTYGLLVEGEMRVPATAENDSDRQSVGGKLFGSYAKQIRYAALSLDGGGPTSYGPYALKLREVAIDDRATLLEDNSYIFVTKHDIRTLQRIPQGYRATWGERHKLAVAKLSGQVFAGTIEPEHSKILLSGKGQRQTDEFIEVHIYGGFNNKAVESVRGSSAVKGGSADKVKLESAYISIVKDYLEKDGRTWIEE
jgi:hypothetical protein